MWKSLGDTKDSSPSDLSTSVHNNGDFVTDVP